MLYKECDCCGTKYTTSSMRSYISKKGICKICDEEIMDDENGQLDEKSEINSDGDEW